MVSRLVVTLANPKRTLWHLRIADSLAKVSAPVPISLSTTTGFSPRLGPNYLLYVSATDTSDSIWKLQNGTATELWSGSGARVFGGPVIARDGGHIAFSVRQHGQAVLYVVQADGTSARVVADSLNLQGAPAWAPDGQSITIAADDHGVPNLFRVAPRRSSPRSFSPRVFDRSRVGARRQLCCLLRTRCWHNIFSESPHDREHCTSLASLNPNAGGSTFGALTWRPNTRVPTRRD